MSNSPDTCFSRERNRENQADLGKGFFFRCKLRKKTFINKIKCESIAANKYLFRKKYISSNIFPLLTDAITARQ